MTDKAFTEHQFWSTQPVRQPGAPDADKVGFIMESSLDAVPAEPYSLPSTFEWWSPDVANPEDLRGVHELLRDNYVEDSESMFRFNYSEEFLRWALMPPGYHQSWHVGVRLKSNKSVLGFVAGVPITMRLGTPKMVLEKREHGEDGGEEVINDYLEPQTICEINFLCVHKKLRQRRLGPILIKEVTRRVNLMNIWHAVYTSGTLLPTPFAKGHYFHRSLNSQKLVDVKFSGIPPHYKRFQNPVAVMERLYRLPDKTKTRGLRLMEPADVPQVTQLLLKRLASFDVAPVFNEEEVAHYFLPREGVVFSYVVESPVGPGKDEENAGKTSKGTPTGTKCVTGGCEKVITDFFSFYSLPSTIIGNSNHSLLKVAYVYYTAATSVSITQLVNDLLIIVKLNGFDVCNVVDIYDNGTYLKELKFSPGDGNLYYYFYNWSYPSIPANEVGLVMV
ncbi:N-myristoyl transferase, putative [Trypanosoma brucei gambiense DAL972]|uniref:Glycylpeptide N-tetradecanoyltransferase n=2 Tax=Trypanosoma brucei TaxID=5691 RepID=D0A003_TRYB9|nr:N-myristoyl transferase, putative [Trypanosoma brucei gambiense DAL972]RHW69826.1 N-myristoyltransferase [Trypanosoma brucei equiperdum]CBH16561.1 N-myristoyl transferase, putative [Trypanosoma brucei gambiense DAL972]|eukprot:XP_011778825.1 N-myristoyl transferase, putative [Trypanosoma brucei gambiense DAL972]